MLGVWKSTSPRSSLSRAWGEDDIAAAAKTLCSGLPTSAIELIRSPTYAGGRLVKLGLSTCNKKDLEDNYFWSGAKLLRIHRPTSYSKDPVR